MRNSDSSEAIGITCLAILCVGIGYALGSYSGKKDAHNEAIANNAAHWEVTTNGTPVFVWGKATR